MLLHYFFLISLYFCQSLSSRFCCAHVHSFPDCRPVSIFSSLSSRQSLVVAAAAAAAAAVVAVAVVVVVVGGWWLVVRPFYVSCG